MFLQKFIYFVLIVSHSCISGIFVIRGDEDDYEKTLYCSEDPSRILKELAEIKATLEDLQLSRSEADTKTPDDYMFDARYDTLPLRCQKQSLAPPRNCYEATSCTRRSGYYHIEVSEFSNETFLVECDAHSENGGWTVIQRRHDGSVDFYRTWSEYQEGFGHINGEFFIGLDKLYALTNFDGPQELLIIMVNATNSFRSHARYDSFSIGNESEKYILKSLGRHFGPAADSLRTHLGNKFSTKDQDNDNCKNCSCAQNHVGGWWYNYCHHSNLNGHYGDLEYAKGLTWIGITGYYSSLKYATMMIRRTRRNA